MNPIAKLFVEVGANTNNFKRGMTQVKEEIHSVSKQSSFFANSLSTALGTGLTTVVTKTIGSLKESIDWLKRTGEEFNALKENSQLAFTTMLGSGQLAEKFLKGLQSFAERTPFELPGLIDASQKMIAFGFTAESVIPTLTSIGDAVSGLGGSPEKLQRVITAIGQIKAKGKAQAQEMLQLAEAGIPAWDILAKHLGVTIPEAMKMSEKGTIDATTAINALVGGMNQKFGGLMEKQSKSFTGLRSTFNDLMRDVAAKITKPWFDNAKKGLERMITLMQSDAFKSFLDKAVKGSERLANIVAKVKGTLFSWAGKGFNLISSFFGSDNPEKQIKQPLDAFRLLHNILGKYENKRFTWLSNFTPREALMSLVGFVNELRYGGKFLDYWIGHMPRLLQPIAKIAIKAVEMWRYLSGEGVRATLKKLGSILVGLGSTLSKLVRPFKDALGGLFAQLSTMKSMGFADIFKAVLSSIAQAFTEFIKIIKDEFWPTIKDAFSWVFDSLWSWLSSFDWSTIWSSIKTGLSSISGFISEFVLPVFTDFFSWLISWFTDTGKNQILLNAITTTWNFISHWAGIIASAVEPYLSGFFNWVFSWFTDTAKNQQLLNGIVTVWNFVTEWAGKLISVVSVPLTGFFNWLLAWFTDANKRQQLLNAVMTGWNWVTTWASSIASKIQPYLSAMWTWLSGWFTDPAKNASLWQTMKNGWTAITQWSANLWGWIQPNLYLLGSNLKSWIDTNAPTFGSWINSFSNTSQVISKDWGENWPKITKAFKDFSEAMKTEIPLVVQALSSLYTNIFGESEQSVSDYFTNMITFYTRYFSFLTKTGRIVLEMLDAMVLTTKKVFAFDWNGYIAGSMQFGSKLSELISHLGTMPQLGQGYATGGNVARSGTYMVGENGPEMVNLPMGSRVWDAGQTRGKSSGGNSVSEVRIYNESKFPIDRTTVKEIAIAIQRELNLNGNRVVFAS